jgi:curved DNA-binding protein CbpA
MEERNDLYEILGVLPTAEFVVIRAAFRALAQQYHPDKSVGDKEEAHRRMSELNSAYSVLKDKGQRDEYDSMRRKSNQSKESYFTERTNESPPQHDPLEGDWKVASNFFKDLPDIESNLAQISWRLAYSFRAVMLDEKDFEKRTSVAKRLEEQFFEFHFGKEPSIVEVARHLILNGEREKAAELSRAVAVLGDKVQPSRILSAYRPSSPSFQPKEGPTWQDQEAMEMHGIRYDGESYHYGGYIYQQLENAVTYAKACEGSS